MTVNITSTSERQTMELAARMARHLQPGDLIALEGQLGAGKTCFVRGLAKGLGISPRSVTSPTFVICQEYGGEGAMGGAVRGALIHIDAYRLSGPQELESIGFSEMLESGDAIIAVEWPSRVAAALPASRFDISFEHAGESERTIAIGGPADRIAELKEAGAFTFGAKEYICRTCGRRVSGGTAGPYFPFCSERCRLADLGKWFSETYRTSRQVEADEGLED